MQYCRMHSHALPGGRDRAALSSRTSPAATARRRSEAPVMTARQSYHFGPGARAGSARRTHRRRSGSKQNPRMLKLTACPAAPRRLPHHPRPQQRAHLRQGGRCSTVTTISPRWARATQGVLNGLVREARFHRPDGLRDSSSTTHIPSTLNASARRHPDPSPGSSSSSDARARALSHAEWFPRRSDRRSSVSPPSPRPGQVVPTSHSCTAHACDLRHVQRLPGLLVAVPHSQAQACSSLLHDLGQTTMHRAAPGSRRADINALADEDTQPEASALRWRRSHCCSAFSR